MMRAGIAIGSDLGDRLEHLKQARDFLRTLSDGGWLLAAPVYETPPVDCPPGTPAFLNTVVEIESSLPPDELLRRLLQFEETHGRPNVHGRNTPRTVDLDVLYFGDLVMKERIITLPHPRLHERRFVLQPLADIRPELLVPGLGKTALQLLASLGDAQPVRLFAKDW
jgi:2-amino-4-hydroxy-6-hydroxymethyldihydropteridine diphosphokinase